MTHTHTQSLQKPLSVVQYLPAYQYTANLLTSTPNSTARMKAIKRASTETALKHQDQKSHSRFVSKNQKQLNSAKSGLSVRDTIGTINKNRYGGKYPMNIDIH